MRLHPFGMLQAERGESRIYRQSYPFFSWHSLVFSLLVVLSGVSFFAYPLKGICQAERGKRAVGQESRKVPLVMASPSGQASSRRLRRFAC